MTTAVIIAALLVIAVYTIKSYAKKLSSGCCGAGGDKEKRIIPKDTDISSYPYSAKVKIGGMHCEKCAMRIENAFNKLDGFYAAADFKNGSANIYTKAPVSDFDIRSKIVGLDYSVIQIERNYVGNDTDD